MSQLTDNFKDITGYDIESFLNRYLTFSNDYYPLIVDYYNGSDPVGKAFEELDYLRKEYKKVDPLIELHQNSFETQDFWILIDTLSDAFVKLESCAQMSKWTRSSRRSRYDSNVRVERILRQGETFEKVHFDLGDIDYQDNWTDTAIDNFLIEEQYTPNGGKMFTLILQNNVNYDLQNIVDTFTKENLYGKDIERSFVFENNDLKTVAYKEALKQTLLTTLQTIKGSIPEFPQDGVKDSFVGTNVNAVQYPVLFRDLFALFNKDGRWKEVNLLDLYRKEDQIFMKIEAVGILKDTFTQNISI